MGKYRVRYPEGQEYTRKGKTNKQTKRTMQMSKSRRLENGKSDFTEAKASISTVECSQGNN